MAVVMESSEIRKRFLDFFEKRGHAVVPSSSLIPDDPSVLLTTAGMQQFKKYYTGEADPMSTLHPVLGKPLGSLNAASIQKSFRTSDIDEVGDESHLTFFEMLGNFSFGGYFKEKAIEYAFEFFKSLNLPIGYITVFGGDTSENGVPADEESEKIWRKLLVGSDPPIRIERRGREDNFWGPTGSEGPCGPTTEIYVNGVEVWNIVFNQYYGQLLPIGGAQGMKLSLRPLEKNGVDTGMGLERLAMALQNKKNIFETDLFRFAPLLRGGSEDLTRRARIVADHLRGSVFLLADGVRPSNKGAGYVLRRLLRRSLVQWKKLSMPLERLEEILKKIIEQYGQFYDELKKEERNILGEFGEETEKFGKTLEKGLGEFYKQYPELKAREVIPGQPYQLHTIRRISGKDAFNYYQTFGLTLEIIKDLAKEGGHVFDEAEFNNEFQRHQEISRAGKERKFGGHGLILDTGELKAADDEELKKVTRLHTATHLLHAALRNILGPDVRQDGSDITAERTRFDFTFPRKVTAEELKRIENFVNDAIRRDFPMTSREMPYGEAVKTGALSFFREKYPPVVKVYSVEDQKTGDTVSRELCGGPHVAHTGEIGAFKILKEESSAAGVRRIRAAVEP